MSTSSPSLPGNSTTTALVQQYAELAAKVLLGDKLGTDQAITNALDSPALDHTLLLDPAQITAYLTDVAGQMNTQSGGPTFEDLSDRIADLKLTTSAQGAGTLELHLIDPYWVLPMSGFIQVDENGYLWPPIDINFPSGTQCVWRLCQLRYSVSADMSEANGILTFEDRIVSQLRQMSALDGGIVQGSPGQTLTGFIGMLIDSANHTLKTSIRYVPLVSPEDPNFNAPTQAAPTPKNRGGLSWPEIQNIWKHNQLSPTPPWATSGNSSTTMASAEATFAQGIAGKLNLPPGPLPDGYAYGAFVP